jgi:hypothetical protein
MINLTSAGVAFLCGLGVKVIYGAFERIVEAAYQRIVGAGPTEARTGTTAASAR